MKQADEDSVLVQLTSANRAVAQGISRSEDAVHILASLSEQYGPSLMLLNCMAMANIVGGKYEAAEGNLKEAILDFWGENDLDTLMNMVVCSQYSGKKGGEMDKYLNALKVGHVLHLFVQGLVQVEGAFEQQIFDRLNGDLRII